MKPIAITMGDPSGVGPEVILKTFVLDSKVAKNCLVVGVPAVFEKYKKHFSFEIDIVEINSPQDYDPAKRGTMQVINPTSFQQNNFPVGEISEKSGKAAGESITYAVKQALEGNISSVVTAPIHKVSFQSAGFNFPGHTEFIADLCGVQDVAMMMAAGSLKVVLATIHTSIASIPELITKENIIDKLQIIYRTFPHSTRVAVCGLNPHAGEDGKFGDEEIKYITPAVEEMKQQGFPVFGPFSGDTIFSSAIQGEFDVVLAMFHDQGLIPVKLLGFDRGINVTLGLPFIRVSVAHGTAFDIAGKGIASHKSLNEAIKFAKQDK